MLELLLCSMLTILPDYLYRRYAQGKRFGREITLYSVWYELRLGIVSCLMLTIGLITVIFYFHPSTTNATLYFRTVPIASEITGRVEEVFVGVSEKVALGAPIFRFDSSTQEAAVTTARRKVAQIEASMLMAQSDILAAEGQLLQAQGAHQQALDELATKTELNRRNPDVVARRELERLQVAADGRRGAVDSATAARQAAQTRVSALLPAEKASAEAALAEAEAALRKTTIYASVSGRVEQFALKPGDIVTSSVMRSAGALIPDGAGQQSLQAGFGQIEGQVMKVGMLAEVTCVSKPWTVIPMVVTGVQNYIAAGQYRGGEMMVEIQRQAAPGSLLVYMEPLYKGGLEGVTPGSSCIANAYTSNHDLIASGKVGTFKGIVLHAVDAVGIVHAMLLRVQALMLPLKVLVFSGGH
jgi:multidrug resistance efflux pump